MFQPFVSRPRWLLAQILPSRAPTNAYFGVLLFAFGLLLLFFLLINLDRRFREYMGRSLTRPFNFFADIRDRRLIPNAQTSLLAFIISGAFGIMAATAMRSAATFPHGIQYLSALLPHNLYASASGFSVAYLTLVFLCTADFFAGIFILALVVRFWAMFVRGRYSFSDTYNVAVWSLAPLTLLLAADLLFPRMDLSRSTVLISGVIIVAMLIWCYVRVLKGAGVLFDIYPTKIYGYGIILLGIVVAAIIAML